MSDDERRIAYLLGEDTDLDDDVRADLDDVRAILADTVTWENPGPHVEDAVVSSIVAARSERPVVEARPVVERRPRRSMRWVVGVAGAAAAAIAVVVFVSGRDTDTEQLQSALAATDAAASDAGGEATFTRFDSGWRIELDAPGLPRLDDGTYYQAWLKNADGITVPIGTFNEGRDVVLWAGVSPVDFPEITVTREEADGNQDSSGDLVLAGPIVDD